MAFGQVSLRAELFLVGQPSARNATSSSQVALGWSPSPDPRASGYYLCWGTASDSCTNRLDAGASTSVVVGGLETNVTYYFTVVVYDGTGGESAPSNEIQYTLPSATPGTNAPPLDVKLHSAATPGTGLCLSFQASSSGAYDLQASQDLRQWQTLWTTNCAAADLVVFELADMAAYPCRFFRLAQR